MRLIGVDAPEIGHQPGSAERFAVEARDFIKNKCLGKRVRLEFDQASASSRYRDRYGRLLVYIFLLPEGPLLNAEIVRLGYGRAYTAYPFRYLEQFSEHEKRARDGGLGLWASE